jgi:cytochrome d ubiquinol oxidase subunit II
MTAAQGLLALLWVGLTLYALLAGADFGAGFWDLFAGSDERGRPQRTLIEHVIGPVWEANHVWLIFVLVLLWTGFPPVFAAVMSTLYIPLTAAALGIIARGAAFAFRKASTDLPRQRLFGAAFALSSVVTPFFLGAVAGAIACGRVPPGLAAGHPFTSWLNPTGVLGGVLAVGTCAYLAACYLCHDAVRLGAPKRRLTDPAQVPAHDDLAEGFRRRALGTGVAVGAVAVGGIAVLGTDASELFHGLTHRGLPAVLVSALAGAASLVLLLRRRYVAVRVAAAVAVAAVLWGWALAQYPFMLPPSTRYADVAATRSVLDATLLVTAIGAVLLLPSLYWLLRLFQGTEPDLPDTFTEAG